MRRLRVGPAKAGPYLLTVLALTTLAAGQTPPQRFGFGAPAPRDLIAALDTDVRPDGTGLPPGRGTARDGAAIYARQCAACHGPNGEGGTADRLVGPEPTGVPPFGPAYDQWRGNRPDVPFTIGNYWPYATTIFDYVRRAMPPAAPGTLTADETYGVVAWLLAQNGIIGEEAVMSAETLPKVVMPARKMFVPDDRKGGRTVR
jgi:cytochrome c